MIEKMKHPNSMIYFVSKRYDDNEDVKIGEDITKFLQARIGLFDLNLKDLFGAIIVTATLEFDTNKVKDGICADEFLQLNGWKIIDRQEI